MKRKLQEQPWFNQAIALCIAVVLYVVLTRFDTVRNGVRTFFWYFSPVITGGVIAYIVNPLSKLYAKSLFRRIKKEKRRDLFSNLFAFVTVIVFVLLLLVLLIPQLIESVSMLATNLDGYVASAMGMLQKLGVSAQMLDLEDFLNSSGALLNRFSTLIKNNLGQILSTSATAGRGVVQFVIAFLLSMYLLADKRRLKAGSKRLLNAVLGEKRFNGFSVFIKQCHGILNRYIIFNLLDSLIIGIANALFMTVCGMPYVGLVSFVVAIVNLIPTFGPIVGAVIGGFVLVLVNPWQALAFLIFTLVLQTCDAYLIKPKLFGDSLGVSSVWILAGVLVGGRIFGVVGILLAIPGVAILDLWYRDYFLPRLEQRQKEKEASDS